MSALLILTSHSMRPGQYGGWQRIEPLIQELSRSFESITVLSFGSEGRWNMLSNVSVIESRESRAQSKMADIVSLVGRGIYRSRFTLSPALQGLVQGHEGPVLLIGPQCYPLILRSGAPFWVDAMDLGWELPSARKRAGQSLLSGLSRIRTRRDETKCFRRAGGISVLSKEMKKELTDRLGINAARVFVIPIVAGQFQPPPSSGHRTGGKGSILFVGSAGHPPNVEAVWWLVRRLTPLLPDEHFVVVGMKAPPLMKIPSNITFEGIVPSIEPFLEHADIAIAPIFSGSGIRVKIIEYLAASKAVVATEKAVEGIAVRDGIHLLVRNDAASFATAIQNLRKDQALREALGRRGKDFVLEFHDRGRMKDYIAPMVGYLLREGARAKR